MDCFLCDGIAILFRIGLAIFKIKEKLIIETDEQHPLIVVLKEPLEISTEELFKIAFEDYGSVSVDDIRSKKHNQHKSAAIRALEEDTRITKIFALEQKSKFSQAELTPIYNLVQSLTYNDSFELTKTGFESFLVQYLPGWQEYLTSNPELVAKTWEYFSKGKPLINIDEIVDVLDILQKSSLSTRWEACSEIVDHSGKGKLAFDQLVIALSMLLRLYPNHQEVVSTSDFATMLYDKLSLSPTQPLAREVVSEEAFRKPLFSELFGINPAAPRKEGKGVRTWTQGTGAVLM